MIFLLIESSQMLTFLRVGHTQHVKRKKIEKQVYSGAPIQPIGDEVCEWPDGDGPGWSLCRCYFFFLEQSLNDVLEEILGVMFACLCVCSFCGHTIRYLNLLSTYRSEVVDAESTDDAQ